MCLHWYLYSFLTYSYLLCSCLFYISYINIHHYQYSHSYFCICQCISTFWIIWYIYMYVCVYIYIYVMTCYDMLWQEQDLEIPNNPAAEWSSVRKSVAEPEARPGQFVGSAACLSCSGRSEHLEDLGSYKFGQASERIKPPPVTQSANICNELFFMRHKQWVTFSDKVWWQLLRSFSAYSGLPAEYRRTMYNCITV